MTFGVADRGEVTNGTANGTGTTGPGTGKSYHRHCIVQDDEKMGFTAGWMAPTGKAASTLATLPAAWQQDEVDAGCMCLPAAAGSGPSGGGNRNEVRSS